MDGEKEYVVKVSAKIDDAITAIGTFEKRLDAIQSSANRSSSSIADLGKKVGNVFRSAGLESASKMISGIQKDLKSAESVTIDPLAKYTNQIKSIEKSASNAAKSIQRLKATGSTNRAITTAEYNYESAVSGAEKLYGVVSGKLVGVMQELRDTMDGVAESTFYTKDYSTIAEESARLSDSISRMRREMEAVSATGGDTTKIREDLAKTLPMYESVLRAKRQLETSGEGEIPGTSTSTYTALQRAYDRAASLQQEYVRLQEDAQNRISAAIEERTTRMASVTADRVGKMSEQVRSTVSGMWSSVGKSFKRGYNSVVSGYGILGDVSRVIGGVSGIVGRLGTTFEKSSKQVLRAAQDIGGTSSFFTNLRNGLDGTTGAAGLTAAKLAAIGNAANVAGLGIKGLRTATSLTANGVALLSRALSATVKAGQKIGSVLTAGLRGAVTAVKSINSSLGLFNSKSKASERSIVKLRNAFVSFYSMLRTRTIRSAVSFVFEDAKTNIGEMSVVFSRFNTAISGVIDSVRALGAQVAAIAEPVVSTVGPYLSIVVDALREAADRASQFMAVLTGHDTYARATKGSSDYAKSFLETQENANKAKKSVKEYENTVLGFDQLHKLNGREDATDIFGLDSANIEVAKTRVSALNSIAEQIYRALSLHDYRGAGASLAEGVNMAFNWLRDVAGWRRNSTRFTEYLDNFSSFVNGFTERISPETIGRSIADVVNTVSNGIDRLTDKTTGIDTAAIGRKLGMSISSIFEHIDSAAAGRAFANVINSITRYINGILSTHDLFENIADFFTGAINGALSVFDENLYSNLISNGVNGFFTFINHMFSDTSGVDFESIGSKLGKTIVSTFGKIDWASVGSGVVSVTQSGVRGLNGLLSTTVVDSLTGDEKSVGTVIGESLSQLFSGAIESIDPKQWGDLLSGIVNGISDVMNGLFKDTSIGSDLGTTIGETVNYAIGGINAESLSSAVSSLAGAVSDMFRAVVETVDWQGIWGTIVDIVSSERFDWNALLTAAGVLTAASVLASMLTGGLSGTITSAIVAGVMGAIAGVKALPELVGNAAESTGRVVDDVKEAADKLSQIDADFGIGGKVGAALSTSITGGVKADETGEWVAFKGVIMRSQEYFDLVNQGVFTLEGTVYSTTEEMSNLANQLLEQGSVVGDNTSAFLDATTKTVDFGNAVNIAANALYDVANGLSQAYGDAASSTASMYTIGSRAVDQYRRINGYASGGMVGDGQLFIANENGAEMIGTDGGKTAVVNNNQIVSAITTAVKQAFTEAILVMNNSNGSSNDNGDIVLYIGDEEVARASLRGQKKIDKRTKFSVAFD